MFTHVEALVGGINNHGVIHQPFLFQIGDQTAHLIVDRLDATYIILDITLVLPFHQLFAFQVLVDELFVTGFIGSDPGFPLLGSHTVQGAVPAFQVPLVLASFAVSQLIDLQVVD